MRCAHFRKYAIPVHYRPPSGPSRKSVSNGRFGRFSKLSLADSFSQNADLASGKGIALLPLSISTIFHKMSESTEPVLRVDDEEAETCHVQVSLQMSDILSILSVRKMIAFPSRKRKRVTKRRSLDSRQWLFLSLSGMRWKNKTREFWHFSVRI